MVASLAPAARVVNLGPLAAIPPGEGRAFQVAGREIAVFRTRAGAVFATQARCPHLAGPLADGLVGGGKVVCPLHSYAFELATGRAIGHACGALRTYPVGISPADEVLLTLDEEAAR
jgi:nitrite reductase (NADH) small subunit